MIALETALWRDGDDPHVDQLTVGVLRGLREAERVATERLWAEYDYLRRSGRVAIAIRESGLSRAVFYRRLAHYKAVARDARR